MVYGAWEDYETTSSYVDMNSDPQRNPAKEGCREERRESQYGESETTVDPDERGKASLWNDELPF